MCSAVTYLGMMTPILLFFEKLKVFLSTKPAQKTFVKSIPHFKELRFDNVSFHYPDGRVALSNVSFSIRKGEKLAIVADNGAGKTTLVKLLLGFYKPSTGKIWIDHEDLHSYDLKTWRKTITGVFQDFARYHFSVEENIILSRPFASAEQVHKAVEKGKFTSILLRLPQKLNTLLGKEFGGTALSGGEWQRLAIARAFLRDVPLLILDEPTASLDPISECEIFEAFATKAADKTALFITHRLGSVKMAKRILMFREGRLIEEGSFDSLVQTPTEFAFYFQIQANQFAN